MSAEWPELFISWDNKAFSSFLNERKLFANNGESVLSTSCVFLLSTEYYQDENKATLVRYKQMYLKNFFAMNRVGERIYGITKPITNLADNVLTAVYKTKYGFFTSFGRYLTKYLRHLFIDSVTVFALVVSLIYDIAMNKIYDRLIQPNEWTGDFFLSWIIRLVLDIMSVPLILLADFIRHSLSLIISIICLSFSWLLHPVGYFISVFFNATPPQSREKPEVQEVDRNISSIEEDIKRLALEAFELGDADKKQVLNDLDIQEQAKEVADAFLKSEPDSFLALEGDNKALRDKIIGKAGTLFNRDAKHNHSDLFNLNREKVNLEHVKKL
ncbi:MAG: hypothetical protein VX835_01315 [Pseudomonadota bacterium]|nr:hypothetical protein [Pseudomonadota bacterium]